MIKFVIRVGSKHYVIRTAHDLYIMYNDFVSINDEHNNLSPKIKHQIEIIRDHYQEVYDKLPSDYYPVGRFEKKAMALLEGGQ